MRCSTCAAYRAHSATAEGRQRASDGFHKYLGARLNPDRLVCDGCQAPDAAKPKLILPGCKLRKCVIYNGFETCAECARYPCEDLLGSSYVNREWAAKRIGGPVPEDEYLAFVEPYENLIHLHQVRASLPSEAIAEPRVPEVKDRTVALPASLSAGGEEWAALRALHRVLAAVPSFTGQTYARETAMAKERQYLLRMLWALGREGTLSCEGGTHLELTAEELMAHKIPYSWEAMQRRMTMLEDQGVRFTLVPLVEQETGRRGWHTERGSLRKKGWKMELRFAEAAGGEATLKELQRYTGALECEVGTKAFRRFSRADMRVLAPKAGV